MSRWNDRRVKLVEEGTGKLFGCEYGRDRRGMMLVERKALGSCGKSQTDRTFAQTVRPRAGANVDNNTLEERVLKKWKIKSGMAETEGGYWLRGRLWEVAADPRQTVYPQTMRPRPELEQMKQQYPIRKGAEILLLF